MVAKTLGDDRERIEIKWPNDVLIDGLKTSGILMEMSAEATRVGTLAQTGIGGDGPGRREIDTGGWEVIDRAKRRPTRAESGQAGW